MRVMLVDDDRRRAGFVEECLREAGFEEVVSVACGRQLLLDVSDWAPDVIVIDMASPDRDLLESLSIVNRHNPMPVVMFSPSSDPEYIHRAVEAGVSTYLTEGVQPESVRPIIEVAIIQFHAFQQVKEERDKALDALQDQKKIDKAKRIIMQRDQLGEDAAYEALRKTAMHRNLKVIDVAKRVLKEPASARPKERDTKPR